MAVVRVVLFNAVTINATANSETSGIPTKHIKDLEQIMLQAASASADANVKLEYAVSPDDTNYTDYADFDDLIPSNQDFTEPENYISAPTLPSFLDAFIKFKVTGLGADAPTAGYPANAADTVVTAYAYCEESPIR